MQIITDLDGCYPSAINDGGAIMGVCGPWPSTPFVWFPDLGRIDLDFRGWVTDINSRGEVVGSRMLESGGVVSGQPRMKETKHMS
jgi:hypothetical protein